MRRLFYSLFTFIYTLARNIVYAVSAIALSVFIAYAVCDAFASESLKHVTHEPENHSQTQVENMPTNKGGSALSLAHRNPKEIADSAAFVVFFDPFRVWEGR